MKEQPFYLGERPPETNEDKDKKDGPELKMTFAGTIPEALENFKPKQRSNEELERAHILSEKHERRSMVVRRLLYLERKREEILGYMMDSGKRNAGNLAAMDSKAAIVIIPLGILGVIAAFIFAHGTAAKFLAAGAVALTAFICLKIAEKIIFSGMNSRNREWAARLEELRAEHEELSREREELIRDIKELEDMNEE